MKKKVHHTNSDVEFLGWQKTLSGEVCALYNITAVNHPSNGSTVSEKTLTKLNLQVPEQPDPEDMKISSDVSGNETQIDE